MQCTAHIIVAQLEAVQQTATHGFGHLGAQLLQHLCVLPHDLRKHGTAQHSTRAEDKQVHTPAQSVSAPYELASMHPIGCFCLSNDISPTQITVYTQLVQVCVCVGGGGVLATPALLLPCLTPAHACPTVSCYGLSPSCHRKPCCAGVIPRP